MNDCIFCKIAAGTIPAAQVYSDDHTLAFLDIGPFEKGHTLVIPRQHYETLPAMGDTPLMALSLAVRRVGQLLLEHLPCDGFNVLQSNGACASQVVPHVHFHVIPRWNGRPLNWDAGTYTNVAEAATLAQRLRGE